MKTANLLTTRTNLKTRSLQNSYLGPIEYMGQKIAQYHNPKIFIEDILGENRTKQFTSILIIGSPGTGKTTLATFIAHGIHTLEDYLVVHLKKRELLNFDQIMENLPNRNVILIFDDVSLIFKNITDPTKRTTILTTLTEARHPKFENSDRRVIVIANIHYVNAIEKMWRSQGGWKFYTDLSNEEIQNFNHMTKSKFKHKVEVFSKVTTEQFRKGRFTVSLTNNKDSTYTIDKPFRFIMCYDSSSLRFFLVPDETCNFCDPRANKHKKTKATPQEIIKLAEKYYGKDGRAGMKLALMLAGHTEQFRNKVVYSLNTSKEILSTFETDNEKIALQLREDAQIKDPRLYSIRRKKTDFVKDLEQIRQEQQPKPEELKKQDDTGPDTSDIDLDI